MTSLKFPPVQEMQIFVVPSAVAMSKLGLQTRGVSKTIDVLTDPIHSMVKGNQNRIEPKLPLHKFFVDNDPKGYKISCCGSFGSILF